MINVKPLTCLGMSKHLRAAVSFKLLNFFLIVISGGEQIKVNKNEYDSKKQAFALHHFCFSLVLMFY